MLTSPKFIEVDFLRTAGLFNFMPQAFSTSQLKLMLMIEPQSYFIYFKSRLANFHRGRFLQIPSK